MLEDAIVIGALAAVHPPCLLREGRVVRWPEAVGHLAQISGGRQDVHRGADDQGVAVVELVFEEGEVVLVLRAMAGAAVNHVHEAGDAAGAGLNGELHEANHLDLDARNLFGRHQRLAQQQFAVAHLLATT